MPYRIVKQDCRQSDDKKGTYVLQKKEKGKWNKVSCHTSEEKAKSSMRARGMNEKYGSDNYNIMKITRQQLRSIIKKERVKLLRESTFAPTAAEEAEKINQQIPGMDLQTDQAYWEGFGISTGEELSLDLLSSTYSDKYKSIHGIRPKWAKFKTVEEVQKAIANLDREVEEMIATDELDQQSQLEYEREKYEFDYEKSPSRSGMGRRMESKMRISRKRLNKIIKESMRRVLNEYGGSFGNVSWREDDEEGTLFDIEGHGDNLTKDKVYDILNDSDTDDSLVANIQMAIEDADEYSSGY